MWYRHKSQGLLGTEGEEKALFYPSFAQHKEKESPAAAVDMWLSTYRPVLVLCKARAMERVRPERKHKKSIRIRSIDEGYSSADSAGDEESVEPMLVDPDTDLQDIIESIP